MQLSSRFDGLSAVEDLLGLERVEACTRYRLGNRFPPGPCREVLPVGAVEVGERVRKAISDQKIAKKVAKPATGPQAREILRDAKASGTVSEQIRKQIDHVFKGEFAGFTTKVTGAKVHFTYPDTGDDDEGEAYASIRVSVDILEQGKPVGSGQYSIRQLPDGTPIATIDLVKTTRQRQGFSSEFNAHLEDWYRKIGIGRVELDAIDKGAVAWARSGYDWRDAKVPPNITEQMRRVTHGLSFRAVPGETDRYHVIDRDGEPLKTPEGAVASFDTDEMRDLVVKLKGVDKYPHRTDPEIDALLARMDAGYEPTPYEISRLAERDSILDGNPWAAVRWLS